MVSANSFEQPAGHEITPDEAWQRIKEVKDELNEVNRDAFEQKVSEAREYFPVLFDAAESFEDYKQLHFQGAVHPDDRKVSYLKMIELVPNEQEARGLYHNALDDETKQAAEAKLEEFSGPAL